MINVNMDFLLVQIPFTYHIVPLSLFMDLFSLFLHKSVFFLDKWQKVADVCKSQVLSNATKWEKSRGKDLGIKR